VGKHVDDRAAGILDAVAIAGKQQLIALSS
jgi:hypothetical protein